MEKCEEKRVASEVTLFAEHDSAQRDINTLSSETVSYEERMAALSSLRRIFDKYLECPTLLDPCIEEMVSTLSQAAMQRLTISCIELRFLLSAIYTLSKVRGRKRIQRFLLHEVRHVEPVVSCLQDLSQNLDCEASLEHPPIWESIYVLWMWMGMLSLVPFSSQVMAVDVVPTIITLGKSHLSQAGPIREVAAACLASWLARPDLETTELSLFIHWSKEVLEKYSMSLNIFQVMGVLQTLSTILKIGQRTEALVNRMETLWEVALLLSESCKHMLIRKLMTKWLARMGCAYLPPRLALWRYQRGRRTLMENLNRAAKEEDPSPRQQVGNDELFLVPDNVEDAVGHMISSLCDPSTVVRWSAAKGIGRLTERLPAICADDILDALLLLCNNEEKDHAWHGACLALAELARRGLLLPYRLGDVVPIIVKAIQFDVRRGQSSVGAHVRDAACYTYWAFARAYDPNILKPFVLELSRSILIACLFDREVNCRRAASAAFQECVGRQGADNFQHGIEILTAADYFSLGNRADTYTKIALHIAQFEEYRSGIISHLYTVKLFHWDPTIRQLSAKSLHGLAYLDTTYMKKNVLPYLVNKCTNQDLCVRHGALLGLSEIILALGQEEYEGELQTNITELVATIEKLRLYRGRGGEIMRSAVCRFVECLSEAKLDLTVKNQVRLLDSIDANLRHPNESIQAAASNALMALMISYFPVGDNGPSERLQKRVVDKYTDLVSTSDHPGETRGYALGLGALPSKLLTPSCDVLSKVIDCLCNAARFDNRVGEERDAETRRNALMSLTKVCETVTIQKVRNTCPPCLGLNKDQTNKVFECFLLALNDYNVDRRGDVGSWSRLAAMDGLEHLTYAAITANHVLGPGYFNDQLCVRIIGGLLKQAAEKIDSVRAHAGECLTRLLMIDSPLLSFVPSQYDLRNALELNSGVVNWASASSTFRLVMNAACIDDFFYYVISGMVISVGGLSKSVTLCSENALLSWTRNSNDPSSCINKLGTALLTIFKTNHHNRRVTLPVLKVFEKLFNKGLFDSLAKENVSFSSDLFECVIREARGCNDVHRLLATVAVGHGLLSSANDECVTKDLLTFMVNMLGHSFPRVRRFTADQLYLCLLEESAVVPNQVGVEGSLHVLLSIQWEDDHLLSGELKELILTLSKSLGLPLPLNTVLPVHRRVFDAEKKSLDEFESYASLVNDTLI